jgi:hypothetical protein
LAVKAQTVRRGWTWWMISAVADLKDLHHPPHQRLRLRQAVGGQRHQEEENGREAAELMHELRMEPAP